MTKLFMIFVLSLATISTCVAQSPTLSKADSYYFKNNAPWKVTKQNNLDDSYYRITDSRGAVMAIVYTRMVGSKSIADAIANSVIAEYSRLKRLETQPNFNNANQAELDRLRRQLEQQERARRLQNGITIGGGILGIINGYNHHYDHHYVPPCLPPRHHGHHR